MRMLNVHITSSTEIFFPSCHLALSLNLNATHERSSGHSIDSAISPYSVKASSLDEVVNDSNKFPIPSADVPFKIKGLNESYEPIELNVTLPPL